MYHDLIKPLRTKFTKLLENAEENAALVAIDVFDLACVELLGEILDGKEVGMEKVELKTLPERCCENCGLRKYMICNDFGACRNYSKWIPK